MSIMAPHQTGCNLAARYLREYNQCNPILTEVSTRGVTKNESRPEERVDVFGVGPNFTTYAADWKNSTDDAVRHMTKPHVLSPYHGVGAFRMIVCHAGVVEWTDPKFEKVGGWPEWLGLVWFTDDGEFVKNREPGRFDLSQRQSNSEWEILRRAAQKVEQNNSVTRRGTADKAFALIEQEGPQTAAQLRRALGVDMTTNKLTRLLDADKRLVQDRPGEAYRLAG